MSLEGSVQGEVRREARVSDERNEIHREVAALKGYVKELLFEAGCFECNRMAAVPQAAYSVLQVRKNIERSYPAKYQEEEGKKDNKSCGFNAKVLQEGRELTPLKYNSKLMNSIWGLYNRYSVHNFKKIDANEAGLLAGAWGSFAAPANRSVVVAEGPVIGASGAGH